MKALCAPPSPFNPLIVCGLLLKLFRMGLSIDDVNAITSIDPWYLRQISEIVSTEAKLRKNGLPGTQAGMTDIKAMGFSDTRLGELIGQNEAWVRGLRHALGVRPVYKRIDTCAAEFAAKTPYLYSTYEHPAFGQDTPECEAQPSNRKKAVILGGGPNRIGQGIEFDYCCCHAAFAMADLGH